MLTWFFWVRPNQTSAGVKCKGPNQKTEGPNRKTPRANSKNAEASIGTRGAQSENAKASSGRGPAPRKRGKANATEIGGEESLVIWSCGRASEGPNRKTNKAPIRQTKVPIRKAGEGKRRQEQTPRFGLRSRDAPDRLPDVRSAQFWPCAQVMGALQVPDTQTRRKFHSGGS